MNEMNDLNIPLDPPETWPAKVSRLVQDVFFPYVVPYVIPAFLAWKLTRRKDKPEESDERVQSVQAELGKLREKLKNFRVRVKHTEIMERQKVHQISKDLDQITEMLVERQDIFCSPIRHREQRKRLEARLKDFAYERNYEKELKLYRGIEDILANDTHCGWRKEENGCLMWVYMELWKTKAKLTMQENVLDEIKMSHAQQK